MCGRYTRAYLRHLFASGEPLAGTLLSVHNLAFYLDTMARVRARTGGRFGGRFGDGVIAAGSVRFRVLACMVFLALCQMGALAAGLRFSLAGFADFRAFYAAGTIVRECGAAQLYDYELQHTVQNAVVGGRSAALPFVYPVYAAVPFVGLSWLGYRAAFWVMFAVNLGLLGVAVWVMLPYLRALRQVWEPLPWLLFACFYPVGIALLQGQVSLFLLVVVC